MKDRYFRNKPRIIFLLLMIAAGSLTVRVLISYRFHESALLYVGVPFLIALALVWLRDPVEDVSRRKRYVNRLIDAFIIMFGSSVVLFEGFLCVAMFIPIYLVVILIMFLFELWRERAKQSNRGTLGVYVVPLVIFMSAFEGVAPQVSFDRHEQVRASRIVQADIATIKRNLKMPIELQKSRPWFLYLFPMPYAIRAGTLRPGDVHEIYFRYYRWFVTNVHEGRMLLEISEVTDNRIRTTFLQDTSYISHYLHLQGTEITLEEIDKEHTRVTLQINFERTLDPYWYFGPVERYGVKKTAEFLIAEVVAREQG